jgi:hypothetical protein
MIPPSPDLQKRIASVHRDATGEPRGVAIWITATELKKLDINIADAAGIAIDVTEDGIRLSAVKNET